MQDCSIWNVPIPTNDVIFKLAQVGIKTQQNTHASFVRAKIKNDFIPL
jgi:hypothetical protein